MERLRIQRTLNPTRRRNYMLDLLIIVVTILTFVAFIGFTEVCERL